MKDSENVNGELLVSLIENNTTVFNLSNSLNTNEYVLMIKEHFSIINGNPQLFTEGFEATFASIIRKIGELIRMLIDWVKNKLSVFIRKLKKEKVKVDISQINKNSTAIAKTTIDIELSTINLTTFYDDFSLDLRTLNYTLFSNVGFRQINRFDKSSDISKTINKLNEKLLGKYNNIKVTRNMQYNITKADKIIGCFNMVSSFLEDKYEKDVKKQISSIEKYYQTLKQMNSKRSSIEKNLYNTTTALGVLLQNIILIHSSLLSTAASILSEAENSLNTFRA